MHDPILIHMSSWWLGSVGTQFELNLKAALLRFSSIERDTMATSILRVILMSITQIFHSK